ncbi:hypothetical protein [Sulfuriflexus mobilis]|uniref:hypothetical protein n=1 Tax=Sulfuriflexus mobilis TaxID=1811807 RepID=UPI000F848097|nr:hypothetical protein [Sulfuriflexus mobilis]
MGDETNDKVKITFEESINEQSRHFLDHITPEKINLDRTSAYAVSAISFATILALLQINNLPTALHVSVLFFSLAIPILIFCALLNEAFLWLGEKSYEYYKGMHKRKGFFVITLSGYALFGFGYFSIIWHISILAFAISCIAIFLLVPTYNYLMHQISKSLDTKK